MPRLSDSEPRAEGIHPPATPTDLRFEDGDDDGQAEATHETNEIICGGGDKDEVYEGAVQLRVMKVPAHLLMSAAYSINFWDLKHFMRRGFQRISVRERCPKLHQKRATVFRADRNW